MEEESISVNSVTGAIVFAGYAPGQYLSHCAQCENQFVGDKRAVTCKDCAFIIAVERIIELEKMLENRDVPRCSTCYEMIETERTGQFYFCRHCRDAAEV